MKKTLLEDIGLLVLRLGSGAMMLTHGFPKLLRLFGDEPIKFMDFLGIGSVASLSLAVFAEFLCSILLIIGFKTRFVVIPLIITMCTAAFIAHASDPFGKKELPLLYLIVFLGILIFGGGKFSIDGFTNRKSIYHH